MFYARNSIAMAANVRCRYGNAGLPMRTVDRGIAAFLDGATNGEELLHALYDHILAEPIPQSMRGILQEPQRKALGNSR
jgi:hypothetical protein